MAANVDSDRDRGTVPSSPPWARALRVAPEGMPLIAIVVFVTALLAIVPLARWSAVPMGLLALFTIYFFRDPERAVPSDPQLVLSAADGRVTAVADEPEGLKISVFLNVFDVHVNRSPVAGAVREIEYTPGEFVNAMKAYAEDHNERLAMRLETAHGRVEVIQVAGLIARRIICRARVGDRVRAGERYGLIRFGSCTVVRLPRGATPLVRIGERVTGGVTPIARWTGERGPGR
jgi:phosphatidylserine decarboxylase